MESSKALLNRQTIIMFECILFFFNLSNLAVLYFFFQNSISKHYQDATSRQTACIILDKPRIHVNNTLLQQLNISQTFPEILFVEKSHFHSKVPWRKCTDLSVYIYTEGNTTHCHQTPLHNLMDTISGFHEQFGKSKHSAGHRNYESTNHVAKTDNTYLLSPSYC